MARFRFTVENVTKRYNKLMLLVAPHMQTDGEVGKEQINSIDDMYNEVCYHYYERYSDGGWNSGWNMEDPDERIEYYKEKIKMKRFIDWFEKNKK